jgi:hypothetical protein
LSPDGEIFGTPMVVTNATFSIAVTGADGRASTNFFTLRILKPGQSPFEERFDGPGIPDGWILERVQGNVDWVISAGTICPYAGATPRHPPVGLSSNACLWTSNSGTTIARLVSPPINLGNVASNAVLTFQLHMAPFLSGRDELRIRYKANWTDNWTTIATFNMPITKWTPQTIELPNTSSTYYIAFEGLAEGQVGGGYGICVADVSVFGDVEESSYDKWVKEHFPNDWDNPLISGPEADPDGDGLPNLMEYAMGTDPNVPDNNAWIRCGVTNLVSYAEVPDGRYFYLKYRRALSAEGVTFNVLGVPSLDPRPLPSDWLPDDIRMLEPWEPGIEPSIWSWVYNIHLTPTTNAPTRFMRLRVELD